jgi:hypothetical protein
MGHKLTMCFREAWGKCLYFSLAAVVNNMKYYYYYYYYYYCFGTNEPIHHERGRKNGVLFCESQIFGFHYLYTLL